MKVKRYNLKFIHMNIFNFQFYITVKNLINTTDVIN
jgi:hypothetical protein